MESDFTYSYLCRLACLNLGDANLTVEEITKIRSDLKLGDTASDFDGNYENLINKPNITATPKSPKVSGSNTLCYNLLVPSSGTITWSESSTFTATQRVKLQNTESGAKKNVQADWAVDDKSSDSYIKNKPDFPNSTNVKSNWKESNSSDLSYIKNKPSRQGISIIAFAQALSGLRDLRFTLKNRYFWRELKLESSDLVDKAFKNIPAKLSDSVKKTLITNLGLGSKVTTVFPSIDKTIEVSNFANFDRDGYKSFDVVNGKFYLIKNIGQGVGIHVYDSNGKTLSTEDRSIAYGGVTFSADLLRIINNTLYIKNDDYIYKFSIRFNGEKVLYITIPGRIQDVLKNNTYRGLVESYQDLGNTDEIYLYDDRRINPTKNFLYRTSTGNRPTIALLSGTTTDRILDFTRITGNVFAVMSKHAWALINHSNQYSLLMPIQENKIPDTDGANNLAIRYYENTIYLLRQKNQRTFIEAYYYGPVLVTA